MSNIPNGWTVCEFGDVLDYIQPTKYIVESTEYSNQYKTPVLTAGKSFIKGYTDEIQNIFDELPVIIFDDFTTASQFVDFQFKVKSSAMKILKPCSKEVDLEYIYQAMQLAQVDTDTHKRYWISIFAKEKLLLPPKNELKRIAAKIEELFTELDKGVESLKTAQAQLKVYRQALLKHAFEGKLTADWRKNNNAPDWEDTTVGDQLSFLTSGSRGWAKFYSDSGDIFIRAQNIKHDCLNLDDIAYVSLPSKSEGMRTRVQVGDLLITITGANVTKTAYLLKDIGAAYVSQHVALARPIADIHTEFLYLYLVTEAEGRKQLKKFAYGAGKPGLNLTNIKDVTLKLPCFDEQIQIASVLNEKLSVLDHMEMDIAEQLKKSEALRQSILKKAFSGELVKQDPSDEPASKLLGRIKAEKAAQLAAKKPTKKTTGRRKNA